MNITKVLETVFLKKEKIIALILEDTIVISLWNNQYYSKEEALQYIEENFPGWVQSKEYFDAALLSGKDSASKDYITPYMDMYDKIDLYAKEKFKDEYKWQS